MTVYATLKPNNHSSPSPEDTLGGESIRVQLHVILQFAAVAEELDVSTIHPNATSGLLLQVLLAAKGSEAPVLGDDDLLPARELVLRAAQSLESDGTV